MRPRGPIVLAAVAAVGALLAVTGVGQAGTDAVRRALFADNAGAVNGIKASRTPRAGRLVPLGANRKLPRSVLPAGLRGPRGPQGTPGAAGIQGPDGTQGPAGRSALTVLQTGERVLGVYAMQGQGPNLMTGVTLPVPAPEAIDSLHVVVAGSGGDPAPGAGCAGTAQDPVSAPGFVCAYPILAAGVTTAYGWGIACACGDPMATGDGRRHGFMVQANGAAGLITATGVWVYTAP